MNRKFSRNLSQRGSAYLLGQLGAMSLLFMVTSCRTLPPLPTPTLDTGDWLVRRGQAVWMPGAQKQPVAGEFLVATNRAGDLVVEFSKVPFPTIIAQTTARQWQLQVFPQNQTWTVLGKPPEKIIWFQAGRALTEQALRRPWLFGRSGTNEWSLENSQTGEKLRGFLR
jgi:hypothetical protein